MPMHGSIEPTMHHKHYHWLEKFAVQLATVAAVAATYFALWPLVRNGDPQSPLTFLAAGGWERLAIFVGAFWLLSVIAAVVTAPTRATGTVVVALIGIGGLSLRSPQMRDLLWVYGEGASRLFVTLLLETAILAGVLVVGLLVVGWIRQAVRGLLGRRESPSGEKSIKQRLWAAILLESSNVETGLIETSSTKSTSDKTQRSLPRQLSAFLLTALVLATALVLSLMRSAQRGQILFALVAAFFIAVLVAYQFFPCRHAGMVWVLPILLGMFLYAIGAVSAGSLPSERWMEIRTYARALPIDWLSAGCGGAVAGYWVALRIQHARQMAQE